MDNGHLDTKQEWDDENVGVVDIDSIETESRYICRLSEMFWSLKGWTGRSWGGRYVGCPELPNGTPLIVWRSHTLRIEEEGSGDIRKVMLCSVATFLLHCYFVIT